jgi:hypothetical protein
VPNPYGMERSRAVAPPRRSLAVAVGASVAVALAPAQPWATSGRALRSGFALARVSAEIAPPSSGPLATLVLGVGLLPLLAAAAWTAACLRRPRLAALLAGVTGLAGMVAAVVVWRSPLQPAIGPAVAGASGAVALVVGALVLARRQETR